MESKENKVEAAQKKKLFSICIPIYNNEGNIPITITNIIEHLYLFPEYDVEIVDEDGNVLPDGQAGEICIIPKQDPSLRLHTYDRARIDRSPCPCGRPAPRLMDMKEGRDCDPDLLKMAAELHQWDSVLDAKVSRGEYGLELEMIVFPGLMLPKLPNFAKLVVRNWDPENDEPFRFSPLWKSPV